MLEKIWINAIKKMVMKAYYAKFVVKDIIRLPYLLALNAIQIYLY